MTAAAVTIAVVVSRADAASVAIGERLCEFADWTVAHDDARPDAEGGGTVYRAPGFEFRTFDGLHLHVERAAEAFDDPDLVVFASRHAGETGPLLTAHATGNFGSADYGGSDRELARAAPNALARVRDALEARAPEGYEVGMECTHHGPTDVGAPSLFVEVGSAEPQWSDPAAARAVARAILDLRGVTPDRDQQLVGFGGGHYVPRFERVVRETGWAVGHVGADWCLEAMGDPGRAENRAVLAQAFERSRAEHALVDGDHPAVERAVEDLGYRVVSETWVREVDGVPLEFARAVEGAIAPVDEGLRFGRPARGYRGEFAVADLPADLLSEALGIDRERVREAVASRALAFATEEGGTNVAGRVALADAGDGDGDGDGDRAALIDALAAVLEEKYGRVERRSDAVVAHETAFDPERARELGVPEGPAFGKLADGEPVAVDGRTVAPEDVRVDRTRRFSLR